MNAFYRAARELHARYRATWALRRTGRMRDKMRAVRFIATGGRTL